MLTYVINTSENKTFDSSRLFALAGYSKIRWIQCPLNEIPKCVEYISEKQSSIIADDFRIAVVVDFYNFDKIRIPYGRRGYDEDFGVDMSLYMPYIEVYLLDNLVVKLENKDLFAADFEIYYVQNERSERYELFNSATTQIRQILSGNEEIGKRSPTEEELKRLADREISDKEIDLLEEEQRKELIARGEEPEEVPLAKKASGVEENPYILKKLALLQERKAKEDLELYKSFVLYCTPSVSLEFFLKDYPYGALEMSFDQFWDAFRDRVAIKSGIRRHYYVVPYGGGQSRSALHTLSLSLYLIHFYEREESSLGEGDMDVEKINSRALCEVLENGWSKINAAKIVAKKNEIDYYALDDRSLSKPVFEVQEERTAEDAIKHERASLPDDIVETRMSGEKLYQEIESFADRGVGELKARNREEFDNIMREYLKARDNTRDADVATEFLELKRGGFLKTTKQCPSREQYNHLIDERQKQISNLFEKTLSAEYIEVDYTPEKEKAEKAYLDYTKAKAWTTRNILGDIVFLLLSVAAIVIPYAFLQLTSHAADLTASFILALVASGFFAALFVCSVVFQLIPIMYKLKKAKKELYNCYLDCWAKEKYSFSSIRRRYERELLAIEQTRYEMRQITHLFDENLEKEKNVLIHRKMLDDMSDTLSSMLNNLDVEPVFDESETVGGEFDLSKSLYSKENKVYQIFSVETIEKIFSKKGRDRSDYSD